jgi:hypothetical protein
MIELDVAQGSPEWLRARIGLPTASEFDKIVTPATGKYSASAKPYMLRLLVERLTGEAPEGLDGLPQIERGKALEPDAVSAYELETGLKTRACGLVLTDDGRFGASPDRLVIGKAGGVEIKCPGGAKHLGYWLDGFGNDYKCQCMGQMLVAELDYVDMFSYHPHLPSARYRCGRDDAFIATLADALNRFHDEMMELETKLRATGFFAEAAESEWTDYLARLARRGELLGSG